MSLLKPQFIGERVVVELKTGPLRGPALLERLDQKNQHYTKQAMYAALRELMTEDVVVKHHGAYSLNTTWILKLQTFAAEAGLQYGAVQSGSEILTLERGESVSYTFSNVQALDTFWGHAQNLLLLKTPKSEPVYAYDPHYWFLLAHGETEKTLLEHIALSGRQFLMGVSGVTKLDKSMSKYFDGTATQYAYVSAPPIENAYLSSIGDYCITVILDPKVEARVGEIFGRYDSPTTEVVDALKGLLRSRSKSKIKISHNPRKAHALRARLKKYFFVKN